MVDQNRNNNNGIQLVVKHLLIKAYQYIDIYAVMFIKFNVDMLKQQIILQNKYIKQQLKPGMMIHGIYLIFVQFNIKTI